MKVYRITCREELPSGGSVFAALGNFDGVHPGHRAILSAATDAARACGVSPGVFTFREAKAVAINSLEERMALLEAAGIEVVWLAEFDALRDQSPEDFVNCTLKGLGVIGVSCGFNFRFGYQAAGDVLQLSLLCRSANIDCRVLSPIKLDGVTVSSTEIRNRISSGDLTGACSLLGRPWSIAGKVLHGRSVGGRVLSSPTLNLPLAKGRVLPPFGVYFTECSIEGIRYPAVTNLGIRPTFGESEVLCETHLLDASGDFYGKAAEVRFLAFHRPEQKFSSPTELAGVIANDIDVAHRYFEQSGISVVNIAKES